MMDGQADKRTSGQTDGQTDGRRPTGGSWTEWARKKGPLAALSFSLRTFN